MSCFNSPAYSNISSVSVSGQDVDRCQVCGTVENVLLRSDGTLFCRACWAFYRRSITQSRQYTCSRSNNCIIDQDGMRNVCRACRLKKCVEVGMRADQVTDLNDDQHSSTLDCTTHLQKSNGIAQKNAKLILDIEIPASNDQKYPILNRILRDFETILSTQKSIFIADSPAGFAINFTEFEARPLTWLKCKQLIEGTSRLIRLLFSKTRDVYGDINLEGEAWNQQMTPFFEKFKILFKFFLSTNFGGLHGAENRLFIHFGYYFDLNNLGRYLEGIPLTPEKVQQKIAIIRPVLVALGGSASRMRALKIRDVEFAALGAIIFWEHVEKNHLANNSTLMCKEALYAEFHANLIETYGIVKAGIRLIDLMAFIPEIVLFESNFNEMRMISKIFLDEVSECECGN